MKEDIQERTKAVASDVHPSQLFQTLTFAADKHRLQRRKDAEGSPYINHPIAVATVLSVEGDVLDRETLLAGILHDTVEDTETTFEELERHFGKDVANLVAEVTDDKSLDKALRKELQVEHAATASEQAKEIKIADKICNIRDISNCPPEDWSSRRRTEYLDWSVRVVDGCRGVNSKLDGVFDKAIAEARKTLS